MKVSYGVLEGNKDFSGNWVRGYLYYIRNNNFLYIVNVLKI